MSKKQKYYVVWNGVHPGIYNSWAQCQAQVKSFPNALYKSFKSEAEAKAAYHMAYEDFIASSTTRRAYKRQSYPEQLDRQGLAVDAACSGNPGILEYRGVWLKDHSELFRVGPIKQGTNNIGEFLAIVHALALLHNKKAKATTIFTDSKTGLAWVRKKKANTKLKRTNQNVQLFDMIQRAETWLQTHEYPHKITKWDTKNWGEIPADFGRK